jgi:hypothetical protein
VGFPRRLLLGIKKKAIKNPTGCGQPAGRTVFPEDSRNVRIRETLEI